MQRIGVNSSGVLQFFFGIGTILQLTYLIIRISRI